MNKGMGFLFTIEFEPFGSPPGLKGRFEVELREVAVIGRGLKCHLGSLGGMKFTYGFVWRPGGDITLDDRDAFERWLRDQPITAKVALGDPEPMETSDMNREITERLFELDSLSDSDRRAAAEWKGSILGDSHGSPKE